MQGVAVCCSVFQRVCELPRCASSQRCPIILQMQISHVTYECGMSHIHKTLMRHFTDTSAWEISRTSMHATFGGGEGCQIWQCGWICAFCIFSVKHSLHDLHLTCKRGSVGQSEGLSIPKSWVWFRLQPENSNPYGFEVHRPSIKGTEQLMKVIKAIIISSMSPASRVNTCGFLIGYVSKLCVHQDLSLEGLLG